MARFVENTYLQSNTQLCGKSPYTATRVSHCNKYPTLFTPVGKWREVCWGERGGICLGTRQKECQFLKYMLGDFFNSSYFWRFLDYGSLMRREDGKRLSKNRCRGFSFPQRWKKRWQKSVQKEINSLDITMGEEEENSTIISHFSPLRVGLDPLNNDGGGSLRERGGGERHEKSLLGNTKKKEEGGKERRERRR